jgi:membrane-bound ClpP family serine protease
MEFIIPISLFVLGLIAIIVELFVPAGGVIGFLGVGLVISSIITAYTKFGIFVGTLFLLLGVIILPILFSVTFKIFPHTFAGKIFILRASQKKEEGFSSHDEEKFIVILNKKGISLTPLRPIGFARINDKKYNVTTTGEFIDKEEKIRVIKVEGNKIVVRKV